jgi:hypothetical protein
MRPTDPPGGAPLSGPNPDEPPLAQGDQPPPVPSSLSELLGLFGLARFHVVRETLHVAPTFRVEADGGRALFTIRKELLKSSHASQWAPAGPGPPRSGPHLGFVPPTVTTDLWSVVDSAGTPRGELSMQCRVAPSHQGKTGPFVEQVALTWQSTLKDLRGNPVLVVLAQRSGHLGFRATGSTPDGQPTFHSEGDLMARTYPLVSPGGAPLAEVHRDLDPVRPRFTVVVSGSLDALGPVLLALLIGPLSTATGGVASEAQAARMHDDAVR